MVQLTEAAANELRALKEANGVGPTQGIKLIPDPVSGGMAMIIAEPSAGDEVIERDDHLLLIVDRELIPALRELAFDYEEVEVDGQTEQQFTVRREA